MIADCDQFVSVDYSPTVEHPSKYWEISSSSHNLWFSMDQIHLH